MNWKMQHFAILAGLLVAIGTQLGTLEHGFQDALTPGFISGLLVQIGVTVGAMLTGSPIGRKEWSPMEREEHRMQQGPPAGLR